MQELIKDPKQLDVLLQKKAVQKSAKIPIMYYWENYVEGVMTCAFKWRGQSYGLSFPLPAAEDREALWRYKIRLKLAVRETLDVILHHGKEVLDSTGNLSIRLLNDLEAQRGMRDKNWAKEVAFVNFALKDNVEEITMVEARKLGLL